MNQIVKLVLGIIVLSSTICIFVKTITAVEEPLLHIEHGTLRGSSHLTTANGRKIYSFEGIPFARPPIGKYRFKEPQPLRPWRGIWDARKKGSVCLQYNYILAEPVLGDEDCLFINVYTPRLPNNLGNERLMDVIVCIHGGAFLFGSGNNYSPKYLLDEDVVYVTLNYRVGAIGFFSTEDEVVPGNNGLKDQQFALMWVQRNIKVFGGNPASVTIVGMSAGGASVHYHYFSPKSVGLFHRGISMSLSAVNSKTQATNLREKADKIGASLGCPTKTSYELIECLQYRPARRIVSLVGDLFMPWPLANPYAPFAPTVEVAGPEPFINKHPVDLLLEGSVQDIPWLVSVTSEEGLEPVARFFRNETSFTELDERWSELAPILLGFSQSMPVNLQADAALRIKKEYLGNESISPTNFKELVYMFGDRTYAIDVERAARLQAAVTSSPVYFYRFSYRGKHSSTEVKSGSTQDLGVSHGDDTMYVLGTSYGNPEETEEDKAMTKRMVEFWLSFVKTGVPSSNGVTWDPVKPNNPSIDFLEIKSASELYMNSTEYFGRRNFWETLPINEPSFTMRQPLNKKSEL